MTLVEKLSLLDLSEKESNKAKEKFMATLSLVSEEELKEILELLKEKGIRITKANEIKVLGNSIAELTKCFSILQEIHHEDIYKQDVNMLNKNVIDLHRMITYYEQNGIPYRNENGEYDLKMFSESAWKNILNKNEQTLPTDDFIVTLPPEEPKEESKYTFEKPEEDFQDVINFNDFDLANDEDISFPLLEDAQKDMSDIETSKNSLIEQKENLEEMKKSLEEKLNSDDILNFDDLDTESFGMGGRAA